MGKNSELTGNLGSPVVQDCLHHMGTDNRKQHISAAALLPFTSGRALPSKWDDAERWITSPISGPDSSKTANAHPQKQPKSKSGPLGFPGFVFLSNNSITKEPARASNFVANSPLSTGVFLPDGISIHYDASVLVKTIPFADTNNITRSTSVPGLSNLLNEISEPNHQDEYIKVEEGQDSPLVLRRDVATQMSPEDTICSSPEGASPFSLPPFSMFASSLNPVDQDEIRDVQVDKDRGIGRQGRKLNGLSNVKDTPSPWDAIHASKNIKLQRDESRIAAWESLQKAKANAAMQKLELELEKKRSASMEKILKDLQSAQKKAQAMRNSLSDSQEPRTRLGKFKIILAKIRPLTVLLSRRKHHSTPKSRSVLEVI